MTGNYKPQSHDSWLRWASGKLKAINLASARLDAELILAHFLNVDRLWLHAHGDAQLTPNQLNELMVLLDRRLKFEPIAYITGLKEFYGREFAVDNRVLVPRPESEAIIELLMRVVDKSLRVIDVGTGSGNLGITAALQNTGWQVYLSDISTSALEVADKNRNNLNAHNTDILHQDLLGNRGNYDAVIANLPYVPDSFRNNSDLEAEPENAIFAGNDGLDIYRQLFQQIARKGSPPKYLFTESLISQHKSLESLAKRNGYQKDRVAGLAHFFILR